MWFCKPDFTDIIIYLFYVVADYTIVDAFKRYIYLNYMECVECISQISKFLMDFVTFTLVQSNRFSYHRFYQ